MDINPPPAQGNNFLSNTDSNHRPSIASRAIAVVENHNDSEQSPEPGEPGYWSASNTDLVIPMQPATAIYINSFDQIVIRQEDQFGDEDDVIFISRENLPSLIRRLEQFIRPSVIETAIEGSNQ